MINYDNNITMAAYMRLLYMKKKEKEKEKFAEHD